MKRRSAKKIKQLWPKIQLPDRRTVIWMAILFIVPMGLLLKQVIDVYALKERQYQIDKNISAVEKEITFLEKERDKLQKGDPATIEKLAREQLKFTRPGEVILVPPTK